MHKRPAELKQKAELTLSNDYLAWYWELDTI